MKIQIVSDLHLEFGSIAIDNAGADVLVLSGDIMVANSIKKHWVEFIESMCSKFKHVVYVLGNHEHYHGNFSLSYTILKQAFEKHLNLYILDTETKIIEGVVFVGGTLWTNFNHKDPNAMFMATRRMNDYRIVAYTDEQTQEIRSLDPNDTVTYHYKMKDHISKTVQEYKDQPIVICGHHAPSFQSIASHYVSSELNGAYASELFEFIVERPNIKLWTHGHVHSSFDYMIGSTRIVCNPRGYYRYEENPQFNPNFIVEI